MTRKKVWMFLLTAILILALATCGGKEPADSSTPAGSTPSGMSDGNTSWPAFYERFSSLSEDDYNALEAAADDAHIFTMLSYINGDIDLAFTAWFFSEDASTIAMTFGFFGMTDVEYSEKGDTAAVEAKDSEGIPTRIQLKYDGTGSAELCNYENGERISVLSLCIADGYWARCYYSDTSASGVQIVGYDNGDIYEGAAERPSLYKNAAAAADPSFATGMPKHMKLVGGAFFAV